MHVASNHESLKEEAFRANLLIEHEIIGVSRFARAGSSPTKGSLQWRYATLICVRVFSVVASYANVDAYIYIK